MPSHRDRQQSICVTTVRTAALALLAGTMASVTLAQDGKDPKEAKDPKASQPAPVAPAKPAPKPVQPVVQPTARDGKATVTTPKANPTAQPAPSKDGQAGKANPPPGFANPPAATPAHTEEGAPAPIDHNFPPPPDGWFRFGPFADAVDVKVLVDMVAERLKIQIISTDTALRDKKIQLYTPVDVPEEKLVEFLGLLLDQNGQYIRKDALGFYVIEPRTDAGSNVAGDMGTTQVVPTRGLKPSSLSLAIAQVLKGGPGSGQPGQPQINTQAAPTNIAFLDDLGVLVITDTPRRIAAVKGLIEQLSDEQINLVFTRFEVHNLSASIAKQRMLELLGQSQRTGTNAFNPNNPNENNTGVNTPVMALGGGVSTSNLATRLIPDPQANALSLRGRPEEVELITRLLQVVDVPNKLVPKWYPVGPASQALAEQGKRAGLGDVTAMQSTRGGGTNQQNNQNGGFFQEDGGFNSFNNRFGQNNQTANGPVFVLDADQRGFMYYGTPEQHAQLDKLVKEFGEITQAERVVYEFYKLKFVDAEKTSDLIRGMINNTVPGGESPLIPGTTGGSSARRNSVGAQQNVMNNAASAQQGGGGGLDEIVATDQVHVLPDKSNNQVVVKAPQRLQAQFARLIDKIDLRRPQVYIDAKIIVVTNREDFQLAVETQLLNAGDTTNVVRTLFPGSPTTIPTPTNILTPPVVTPATGIVAAIIKSDQVPIVINALAQSRSGRVVASPQLLVDDNEEATITSINEEPTTTTTIGTNGNPNTTSFAEYVEAGPKLTVKPRLSTGDLLSMKYDLELSSFTGAGTDGVPPPKTTSKLKSDSVTLPSGSTIVVGGLELSQKTSTVFKVPFLGDIPIVGELFKSTNTLDDKRTVYVFITPRIMRDPIGNDLRFFTEGPARRAALDYQLPPVQLELIEIHGANSRTSGPVVLPPAPPAPESGLGSDNPVNPDVAPAAPAAKPATEPVPAPVTEPKN